jgi:hypothetical protein
MAFLRKSRFPALAVVLALAAAFVLALSPPALADSPAGSRLQLNEQTIKAGLVYNFLKYTTWPGQAKDSADGKEHLKVCLLGISPTDSYLAPLAGQTAQQSVIDLVRKSRVDETPGCNMVFIDSSQKPNLPAILSFLKNRKILTISDMNQFARMGGMVELAMENNRVALYMNPAAVREAGLVIQERLSKLAKPVGE